MMSSEKELTTQSDNHVPESSTKKVAKSPAPSVFKLGTYPEVSVSQSLSPSWSELEGVFCYDLINQKEKSKTPEFLQSLCELLTNYLVNQNDRGTKVLDFHHPHQLKEMMSHCLDIHPDPRDLEQILSDCKETLKYCVKTGHPHFFNQLSTGVDVIGVAATWLTGTSNTNMFTYEVAPVFTLMEEVILRRMRALVGWTDGDGTFSPGGAISNIYGALIARHRLLPYVKEKGLCESPRLAIFTSEQGHFSIKRAAAILGIGTNNVISVRSLESGKMDVADLRSQMETCIERGVVPLMVNATCGTTVLGAFDPVHDIADLCQEKDVWLHIDGAWGGAVLLSKDHRYLADGIERADSMTWNPHKMMGVPLQCSAFLTKHKDMMKDCNSMKVNYLFQQDKHYDISYDTGDITIQCGRHNDIFNLWLMWRAKGDQGFEQQVNKNFVLATYLRDTLITRSGFHLVLEKFEGPNICFWYLPIAWRSRRLAEIKQAHLHKVAPTIKARMMESGNMMVQYQPLCGMPNFFRVAISNPVLTTTDLDFMINEIDKLGKDIQLPEDW